MESASACEGGLGDVLQSVAEREEGCGDDSKDVSAADAEALVLVRMGGGVELAESMAVSLLCRGQMGAGGCDERRRKEADGCV